MPTISFIDPRLVSPSRQMTRAPGGRLGDELRRDEAVVDEHVARADELQPAGGDQPGIARARADEVDASSELVAHEPAK